MLQKLGKEVMIFDGAFGTELEKRGIMSKMPESDGQTADS